MASSSVVILRFNRSGGQASFGCCGWQETRRREKCTRSNLGDPVGAGKDFHRTLRLSKGAIVDEDGYPARAWTFAQLPWALNSNFAATVCRSGRMPRKCVVFISPPNQFPIGGFPPTAQVRLKGSELDQAGLCDELSVTSKRQATALASIAFSATLRTAGSETNVVRECRPCSSFVLP